MDSSVVCVLDGTPDLFTFQTEGAITENYVFIFTTEEGIITQIVSQSDYDFDNEQAGNILVYGLSFVGEILAQVGDNIFETQLASDCYDLSDNNLQITAKQLLAGSVSLASGNQDTVLCFGDPAADQLSFLNTGFNGTGSFRYVLTDAQDVVLDIFEGPDYAFSDITIDLCKVYGVSYTGNLVLEVGTGLFDGIISDECYDITSDFVNISHLFVEGGTLSFIEGVDSTVVCVQDGVADLFAFQTEGAITENYAFIFTTEEGVITQVVSENNYDFDSEEAGNILIYGLSFVGNILAQAGDNIFETQLASDCYDLSDNNLHITLKQLVAGSVSLASGNQDTVLCFGDPAVDQLSFLNTGFNGTGSFRYVLTNRQDVILDIFEGPDYAFSDITIDFCKVYGVSFTGNLALEVGGNLFGDVVSDECYDITTDFVSISHLFVEGGTVSLGENSAGTLVCSSDGIPDIVTFETNSTAGANYKFILTDGNDNILIILEGNSINLDIANAGICRIYGVSFTDELNATTGMNINSSVLANNCFDLSDNFIEIIKRDLIAGQVRLEDGTTSTEICAGDNYSTVLNFTNDSPQDDSYVYLVTDENNNILRISSSPSITFNNIDIPVCRVYGAIYTGDLLLQVGDNALTTAVSTQCFEVSRNFVTVTHKIVEGGNVSLSDGRLFTNICVRDGMPDLIELATDSDSEENYAYLLTNDRNQLLNVLNSNEIDPGWLSGRYRENLWFFLYR